MGERVRERERGGGRGREDGRESEGGGVNGERQMTQLLCTCTDSQP